MSCCVTCLLAWFVTGGRQSVSDAHSVWLEQRRVRVSRDEDGGEDQLDRNTLCSRLRMLKRIQQFSMWGMGKEKTSEPGIVIIA